MAKVTERMWKWNRKKSGKKTKKRIMAAENKPKSSGAENKERKNKHIMEMRKQIKKKTNTKGRERKASKYIILYKEKRQVRIEKNKAG